MNTPSDDSMTNREYFAVLVARIDSLEKRVAKLERANKPAPKKNPSVGIYYRDGKPMKGKPKKESAE